ncbi:iron-containing alcohol dehydrogenase [Vallitalea guaymasensis]|uniref:Iron-containing alcohol dehydrogenase n=1 Tax=Vallitalea guaymasensis TaxID=1185412 RepID=A0A8J8MAA6_9FIRM|nr:iron-containing alcohol dehydrogenase [Vallitalea guaymasensis]QUH29267.1 iron-containing alcohol dehydrogenase [Vallitalea guaymasensis]
MMRPMKLGGEQLMFGQGVLEHLKTIDGKRAVIVTSGDYLIVSGHMAKIQGYLKDAGIESMVIDDVEPDPSFETVYRGAKVMMDYGPDWIVGVGGGSAMDAAKAMWIIYEHPEIDSIDKFEAKHNNMPPLRNKARMIAIPTTSGTASEVSRSVVITNTETHKKSGASDMKMIPDVVILEPDITASMPPKLTAATGMDALTHAVEAYTSTRANMISDVLAEKSVAMILDNLVTAYKTGDDLTARENMLVASCLAGMAFTNVSLGIVHSIAHTVGGLFGIPHGLADAIILPYVIEFNMSDKTAEQRYKKLAGKINKDSLLEAVKEINEKLDIPTSLKEVINDDKSFNEQLEEIAKLAIADGCTKTNPIVPNVDEMKALILKIYNGGTANEC